MMIRKTLSLITLTLIATACADDVQTSSSPWQFNEQTPQQTKDDPPTDKQPPQTPPKLTAYKDFCSASTTWIAAEDNAFTDQTNTIKQTFDARGLKQSVSVFRGEEQVAQHDFEYNQAAQLTLARMYNINKGMSFLSSQQTRQYDDAGEHLSSCKINVFDPQGKVVHEERQGLVYDEEGRIIQTTKDDTSSTFTYQGNTIIEQRSAQGGRQYTYHFDEQGHFLRYERVDGRVVEVQELSESSRPNDRRLDQETTLLTNSYRYTNDTLNEHITSLHLREQPFTFVHRTFNEQGRLTRFKRSYRQDALIELSYTYEPGRIKVYQHSATGTSQGVLVGEYIYDEVGNLLEVWRDGRGDGKLIKKTTFDYSCFGEVQPKLVVPRNANTFQTPWYRTANASQRGPQATCPGLGLANYYVTEWVTPTDALKSTGVFGQDAALENINPNLIP